MKLSHLFLCVIALFAASSAFASGGEPADIQCHWGGANHTARGQIDFSFKTMAPNARAISGNAIVSVAAPGSRTFTQVGVMPNVSGQRFTGTLSIDSHSEDNHIKLVLNGSLPENKNAISDEVYSGFMDINVSTKVDPNGELPTGKKLPVECNFQKGQG